MVSEVHNKHSLRAIGSKLLTPLPLNSSFFFFNDTATTEIYTLSLHDALPILLQRGAAVSPPIANGPQLDADDVEEARSEEHTSELQSPCNLVCRLLLEKKKQRPRAPRRATPEAAFASPTSTPHRPPLARRHAA